MTTKACLQVERPGNLYREKDEQLMPKTIIAANWKMNKTVREAVEFLNGLNHAFPEPVDREIIVAPPFTALYAVGSAAKGTAIRIAAQNLYWKPEGAFTGEISAAMLVDTGCDYVIIGHSERRHIFGESDDEVGLKIARALEFNLKPIFCVGETLDERESNRTFEVLERQLKGGLNKIPSGDIQHIVIAYEPVWAIGTGKTAKPEQAQEVHQFLRQKVATIYSEPVAADLAILYGGSVNPGNIESIMAQQDINGALVGGASLDLKSFIQLVNFKAKA